MPTTLLVPTVIAAILIQPNPIQFALSLFRLTGSQLRPLIPKHIMNHTYDTAVPLQQFVRKMFHCSGQFP